MTMRRPSLEVTLENIQVGDLVEVAWIDSGLAISKGWMERERILAEIGEDSLVVETVGYYLGLAEEDVILVAQSRDADKTTYLNAQAIYLPNVAEVTGLGAPS